MEPTAPGPAVALRTQAAACAELGSPMYAELLRRSADDVEAGGPVARVLAGHEHDPGPSALGLRLLGSVHRLVLERRAGALAAYYPSVGGTWKAEGGWRAFTALLAEQPDAVREWLDRAPQTNEVGRAPVLYGGLLHLARDLPLRLLEIGASAGLNLRVDRFAYLDEDGRRFGAATDDLVLTEAWRGRRLEPWPGMRIVERLGSDLAPVDPASNDGRMLLTAYVWPDQRHHHGAVALGDVAVPPPGGPGGRRGPARPAGSHGDRRAALRAAGRAEPPHPRRGPRVPRAAGHLARRRAAGHREHRGPRGADDLGVPPRSWSTCVDTGST
jgi:hypothetical protein